jgi:hypothetical protein
MGHSEDARVQMSDAEVTTAKVAARFFGASDQNGLCVSVGAWVDAQTDS